MGKSLSSFLAFLYRKSSLTYQNPNTHVRNFTGETKVGEFVSKVSHIPVRNDAVDSGDQSFREFAREICRFTRTKARWEQTLVSEYPFLNLSDPHFFDEVLKQQNNVFLALRFFYWLHSQYEFTPNQSSCTTLFDALVDAKACKAAMSFLDCTGFSPAPNSLEHYFQRLCEVGLVEEALSVLNKLKVLGCCPSIETWNVALLSCGRNGRTDIVWKLYQEMMDSGVLANIDVQTVGYLILAFCHDKEVLNGFELFQQTVENGVLPANVVLNRLISALCAQGDYARVSQVLHAMIARNQNPDICTYQEIVNGLLKKSKLLKKGLRVFTDLKDRGYFPHRAMYTTLISGLCDAGWLEEARILWFEMSRKGITPNEYTYNALLHGYFKAGNFEEGWKLYREMCLKGYGEIPVSYNTMISGLCLHGRIDEAWVLFQEMASKGVVRDVITYNSLIQGFCSEGKLAEGVKIYSELLAQGLKPTTFSVSPLIEKLSEVGCIQEAKNLWKDMSGWGLEPMASTYEHFITGLCKQGCAADSMEWLIVMMKKNIKPQKQIFQKLIKCLLVTNSYDDTFVVLDLMFRAGYVLDTNVCRSLVDKLCEGDSLQVRECLDNIL